MRARADAKPEHVQRAVFFSIAPFWREGVDLAALGEGSQVNVALLLGVCRGKCVKKSAFFGVCMATWGELL